MIMLQDIRTSPPVACPYLEGRTFVQEYFFAHQLDENEFDYYLTRGWRRFGTYFFRPSCPGCRACVPIRINGAELTLSSSQKKVVKKNGETEVRLRPLEYSEKLFDIYQSHSRRFDEEERDSNDFRETYFQRAVPAFQTEYYRGGEMVAFGFVDVGHSGLSSVYYSYDTNYSDLSLGTYSVIRETQLTVEAGLEWYYLGYYIAECSRMAYKGRFFPRQLYNWEKERWEDG
ncbi:MAG: arginyltransferase [Spirochaetales bacterium]|nr:arginyltransferase [Spirochaetales bacterium]